MNDVTISIISMNNGDMLSRCLDSIINNTSNVTYDLNVIAYLFNKDRLAELKNKYQKVNFIENDQITGFSENNNIILKNSNSRYFFILNDDTYFDKDLISQLVFTIESLDDKVAIVSPVLYYPNGNIQFNGREKYNWIDFVLVKLHLDFLKKSNKFSNKSGIFQTYNISGACFLIKASLMKDVGYFNERYFFCPEDIELSTLINEIGYKVYVNSDLKIIHIHEATSTPIKAAISPVATYGTLDFVSRNSMYLRLFLKIFIILISLIKLILSLFEKDTFLRRTRFYSMFWTIKYIFYTKSYKDLFKLLYKKVKTNFK